MSEKKERLGIYGGTFSPIHSGHVKAAYAFLDSMELDRLLIVPTAIPPHKAEVEGADAGERFLMTRLAFEDGEPYKSGRLEISDFELARREKSYTVYTLEHFSAPNREIYLLVGTDMFFTLDRWYRAQDIFKLAAITLMRRETDDENTVLIERKAWEYREKYGARIYFIDEPPVVVSSTELRCMIEDGGVTDGLIPESVAQYIKNHNLYR